MSNVSYPTLIVAAVAVLVLILFPRLRRVVLFLVRLGIALAAGVVAIGGVALLMNNETIYEKPGVEARAIRFLTQNRAATSNKGLGTARCTWPDEAASPGASPVASPSPAAAVPIQKRKVPPAAASPGASESQPAEDDVYPELITRSYPGIPRQRLFDLSQGVVSSLGGWKIVKANPSAGQIDCIYASRIFGWEDDIRITITPKAEIELCARSEMARPGATSMMRWFPGDFGSNLGHIKQFYETLEPKMDEVYKEEQQKEDAKKPPGMR